MGVWIETKVTFELKNLAESHPVWVCGLKLVKMLVIFSVITSHPVWVCGLKLHLYEMKTKLKGVTPCMGVWIETDKNCNAKANMTSHPVWVCGLKHLEHISEQKESEVTPCMGVWIETSTGKVLTKELVRSHPVWVCGLKPMSTGVFVPIKCHTLYGCVD